MTHPHIALALGLPETATEEEIVARVEKWREALEPFAKYAEARADRPWAVSTHTAVLLGGIAWPSVTVGDFRRARAALAQKEG